MGFIMKYGEYTVTDPSIKGMVVYIKNILDTCKTIEKISIQNIDLDKELFRTLLDEIRIYYAKHTPYVGVTACEGKKWTDCYYYHIPGEFESTLEFSVVGDGSLEIRKIPLEEAITNMRDRDIIINEFTGDRGGIRNVQEYKVKLQRFSNVIKDIREKSEDLVAADF